MNTRKWRGVLFALTFCCLLVISGCNGSLSTAPEDDPIIIRQSGGAGAMVIECQDRDYLFNTADYIIEGMITYVVSRWNEDQTGIFTYSGFSASSYIKGIPLPSNDFQIVTPGGTVGDITQAVEDQPILHEDRRVRLYLNEVNGEFSIICGRFGVEDLDFSVVPAP